MLGMTTAQTFSQPPPSPAPRCPSKQFSSSCHPERSEGPGRPGGTKLKIRATQTARPRYARDDNCANILAAASFTRSALSIETILIVMSLQTYRGAYYSGSHETEDYNHFT